VVQVYPGPPFNSGSCVTYVSGRSSEEESLKLGADLNARNKDCETPIFTTVDNDAIPLIIEHGADQTIRSIKGKTMMETAKEKGPLRQEALRNSKFERP
jgi:hypothetical protein